jgi:hypothetical protein
MFSFRPIGRDFGDPVPSPQPGTKSDDQNKTQNTLSEEWLNNLSDADIARAL